MYHEFPQAHLDLLLGNGLSTLYMQLCLEIGGCFQPCPFTAVEMSSYDETRPTPISRVWDVNN